MRIKHWTVGLFILLPALLLSACSPSLTDEGTNVSEANWMIEDFTYTDQNGEPFGLSDLEGEVWLADFIFTNCTTVCIPMSTNMSKLQQQLEEAGLEIPIVSFSVDPEHDTPEVLTQYANQYNANTATWHFLTGYPFEEIKQLSEETFKSSLHEPAEGEDQFMHGVLFYLVQSDQIIKTYNGVTDVPYEAIVQDVKALSAKK